MKKLKFFFSNSTQKKFHVVLVSHSQVICRKSPFCFLIQALFDTELPVLRSILYRVRQQTTFFEHHAKVCTHTSIFINVLIKYLQISKDFSKRKHVLFSNISIHQLTQVTVLLVKINIKYLENQTSSILLFFTSLRRNYVAILCSYGTKLPDCSIESVYVAPTQILFSRISSFAIYYKSNTLNVTNMYA